MIHAVIDFVVIDAVIERRAQNGDIGRFLFGRCAIMVVFQSLLIAPDAFLHVVQCAVKGRMGVAAKGVGYQCLTRRQAYPAIRLEEIALFRNGHLSVTAALKILRYALSKLGFNTLAQSIPDLDLFSVDLNLHSDISLRS